MASTVSLIQMLATGCFTSTGAPIASGKVRFYLPGTTTPVNVYADSAAATPISPPLTLTAGGTGIAYTKVPTRVIVKDSTETTTYFDGLVNIERAEQLYIQSSSVNGGTETTLQALLDGIGTSFGGVAGLWKFKAGTGGTERNYVDVINDFGISVKSFGAVGDGIVDDTAAVQNTITFVSGLGGGVVLLPPGTYKTSSPLLLPTSVSITVKGASSSVSIVKNSNTTANCFTQSGNTVVTVRDVQIAHASTSSGIGISAAGTSTFMILDNVSVNGHATGISMGSSGGFVSQTGATTTVASTSAALVAAGTGAALDTVVIGGSFTTTQGIGIQAASGTLRLYGVKVYPAAGAIAGVDVVASANLYAYGVSNVGALALGLRTAATSGIIQSYGCDWTQVTDARTGAPVSYTFAANGNFTPLPHQTDSIRVVVTAAATVTINNPATMGFGRKFSLMLCRSTAGAVTWSFDTNYVLQGAAAPAPTNGNMMISIFEHDPISGKYRETSRSASMAV